MCSSTPLLSVIVPVYGVESYIERCAISLFEQTLDNIEFIFVDDKTKDKSIEILEKILNKYPQRRERVKFIRHKENKGLAASRQDGFDIAQGEYIAHCDSDDWVEREMYERMLRKAVEDNADIVCCNYFEEYNKKQIKVEYDISEETQDDVMNSYPSTIYSAVWNKIIKRKLYIDNNIRWFKNINMQEDLGITTRLRILSTKTTILNLCLYHYNKQNISSISIAPKKSNIYEQIECARQLDLWIKEFAGEKYYMLGNKIKFWAKCGLAIHPSTRDIDQWRFVFPETNVFAREFKQMAFYIRWPLYLYAKGFVVIPNFLINLNTCVKLFLNRNR